MAPNSNLCLAMMACLNQRALDAAIEHGGLSKSEVRTINALRQSCGYHGSDIANRKLIGAVHKQFSDRDRRLATARVLVEDYARRKVQEVFPMPTPSELKVAKAADTQAALREAIAGYQASHPGCTRADAIDKILFSVPVANLHKAEVGKLGINRNDGTLPQPRTADIDFNTPLRGTRGYSPGSDDRRPVTAHGSGPQSGEEDQPEIEDANDVLERLAKEHMRMGKTRARAMMDASASKEFTEAYQKERARKYGV